MPFIQCDIRRDRSAAQREELCRRITETVSRITGAPTSSILVLIREHAGDHFMEGGELLPDYVAGPNGEDVAAAAALGVAMSNRRREQCHTSSATSNPASATIGSAARRKARRGCTQSTRFTYGICSRRCVRDSLEPVR
jgi:4-oxalocrotonate tautomerase family enzyme